MFNLQYVLMPQDNSKITYFRANSEIKWEKILKISIKAVPEIHGRKFLTSPPK